MSSSGDPNLNGSAADQSTQALKDKFFAAHNCAVYEDIDTFTCAMGIVEATCKDMSGMTQTDYYLPDPNNPANWLSESDIDGQISMAQAALNAANAQKAEFTAVQMPGSQCTTN
jgi:hypothetical protein